MSSNICTIYLVRHGETVRNRENIMQGQSDSPLTDLGISQAFQAKDALSGREFHAVYSSDLGRAYETAKIIAEDMDVEIRLDPRIRERSVGVFEGVPKSQFETQMRDVLNELKSMNKEDQMRFKAHESMESYQDIVDRVDVFMSEVLDRHRGENVLVVSHGGCIRNFLISNGIFTHEEIPSGSFGNAGYAKVTFEGNKFVLEEIVGHVPHVKGHE